MNFFLFLIAFWGAFFTNNSSCLAAQEADLTINAELVKILDSFDKDDGQDPYKVPQLSDILEAKGTLVFFDNTHSSGKKPEINGTVKNKFSNFIQRTLEKARKRLLGQSRQSSSAVPVFSDRTREPDWFSQSSIQQSPRFYSLDYKGEKTAAFIPPNTFIEVPFLKHIPYFFSRIEILNNGFVKVTETIERVVEPSETDFVGIERYFPKYHNDRTGKNYRTNLTVLEASIDNKTITPKLKPTFDGIKIDLHSEKPLSSGVHLFRVTYLFSNKIAEFKNNSREADVPDFKELIWNVTGSHWDIPVTRAGAIVIFPPQSTLYSQAALTSGPNGYGHNYRITKDKENNLSFVLTFPLAPHESLTILTNWSEKNSTPFFQNGKIDRFIIEHGTAFAAFVAFLFVLSYYLGTFFGLKKNQGQNLTKPAPLQKNNLTAAVLNYALQKEITPKTLFIILLDMACKNFISFEQDDTDSLILVKNTDKETGLTSLQRQIAKKLFTKEETSFSLTRKNFLKLTRIMNDVRKGLIKEYHKKFTVFPQSYFLFGILMAVVAITAITSMSLFPLTTFFTSCCCIALLIPCTAIYEKIHALLKTPLPFEEKKKNFIKLFVPFFFCFCLLLALFVYYALQTTFFTAFFFFALLICIGVFKTLFRTPSVLGKSILENLDGYRLYLCSQDDTLLKVMRHAEQKIKDLYNKHLPFAVALEVQQQWTHRFAVFSRKENQLKPDWYRGKLHFTDTFIDELYTRFFNVFPQEDVSKNNTRISRFKTTPQKNRNE